MSFRRCEISERRFLHKVERTIKHPLQTLLPSRQQIGAVVHPHRRVAFGANLPVSLQAVKTNGVIATYASNADPTPMIPFGQFLGKDVTVRFVLVYIMGDTAHQDVMWDITTSLEAGLRHPVAVQRSDLDAIAAAHRQ